MTSQIYTSQYSERFCSSVNQMLYMILQFFAQVKCTTYDGNPAINFHSMGEKTIAWKSIASVNISRKIQIPKV